jgi:hypothetical protein
MPFGTVIHSLISGTLNVLDKEWWLFSIILTAKFGPRVVRGHLLRKGGLR